jgi:hypothetical protein
MCISCGCWMDTTQSMGGDGNHPEDSSVMPNVKTTVSELAMPMGRKYGKED